MNLDLSPATSDFAQRHGRIQSPAIFLVLCFFTLGLYAVWWQYKLWRFFKEKDAMTIYPVARAIFSLFFIHSLLERLDYEVQAKGHPGINTNTNAWLFIVTAIVSRLIGRIPGAVGGLSLLIPPYVFLIPSVKQLNYYWEAEAPHAVPRTMSSGAIVALVFGVLFLVLVLLGLLTPDEQP